VTVLGVDWAHHAWAAVAIDDTGFVGGFVEPTIERVEARALAEHGVGVIVVDIPIGLPDASRRLADTLAQDRVGARRTTVFFTPIRAAIESPDHASATAASVRATGGGISTQAYALRTRILDVDGWVPRSRVRMLEGHPEVSFAAMGGAPLAHSKHSAAGLADRGDLLASVGLVLPRDAYAGFGTASLDDVYDAAAMAWTARRVERGEAVSLPDPPEVFSDGLPAAIWV